MVTRLSTPQETAQSPAMSQNARRDPNTLSNYDAWRTTHTTANFDVDFEKKQLRGTVTLSLKKLAEQKQVVLDTSYLDVSSVRIANKDVKWDLAAKRTEPYGSALTVSLPEGATTSEVAIEIAVATTKDCTALQWMTPAQTSNKKHPYMFSQCQAIHARSLLPCQDTPDVKSTYTFNLRSPLPVLASGLPTKVSDFRAGADGKPGTLLYSFQQDVPMPSYLFALASGDIASAAIGPRSTVYTGPEELKDCQWEFEADTEKYIQIAEKLVYPYEWTTYNVLVLPPSFPYGGMENPQTTYATPTLISGDRQNVDVIAHELSHSWSGNLVSCASWEHFWLNEGWTTYLERRIQAAVHKDDRYRDFSALLGWKALSDSIAQFGADHEFTKLMPNLEGKDPDDAFSSVPYEKGFLFLYYLEKLVGQDKWDPFIKHYFTTFKHKSVDTFEFKKCLYDYFEKNDEPGYLKLISQVQWQKWLSDPGFPQKPDFDTSLADVCYDLAKRWQSLGDKSAFKPTKGDLASFSGQQIYVFLEALQDSPTPLPAKSVELMGSTYAFEKSKNVEIVSRFYVLALRSKAEKYYGDAAELAGSVGRMKFVRPLYKELLKVKPELAKQTYENNKDFYHPICRGMIEKIIAKEKGSSA
ncbi:Leukotriene A-4 hydrolase [Cryoendolithus antarcticus]|uniref:Leukotriene A(4) hydrolase n=1 Tax=Cryoendolithus antarcticus TaxID=1507870 RepID=A0A1V8SUC9_9PEZI|nr:Leukotriene A-4 hydrolase [Cryoendolithus antarcticus]